MSKTGLRTVFCSRQACTHKAKEERAAQAEIHGEKKAAVISSCFDIYKTQAYYTCRVENICKILSEKLETD